MQKVTRKKLESIVDELNIVLGFKDDPIPKKTEDQMIHDILEIRGEISPDDPFKKTTLQTIEFLASEPEEKEKIESKKEKKVKPKKEKVKKEKIISKKIITKMPRNEAFAKAILSFGKKEFTKKELFDKANEFYCSNKYCTWYDALTILTNLNLLTEENGKFKYKG